MPAKTSVQPQATSSAAPASPRAVLLIVAIAALAVAGLSIASTQLWISPDSAAYITLGIGIAERGDCAHELFQVRPPGYPLILAAIFRVCGPHSPLGIQVVQHLMIALTAVLTAATAWTLWPRGSFALVAGLLAAGGLHLWGYGNAIMAEAAFACAQTAGVYLLVRHHVHGGWKSLAGASLLAGTAALIRPIGQALLPIILAAAVERWWRQRHGPGGRRPAFATLCGTLMAALLPGAAMLAPVAVMNYVNFDGVPAMTAFNMYNRAVFVEQLRSDRSAALNAIIAACDEARRRGILGPDDDPYDRDFGWKYARDAYCAIHGVSITEAFKVLDQAGWDLVNENRGYIVASTLRYTGEMLWVSDSAYRRQPAAGRNDHLLNPTAWGGMTKDLVGRDTIAPYLAFYNYGRPATGWWNRLTGWYYDHVDAAPSVTGLFATRRGDLALLLAAGALVGACLPTRRTWILVAIVILHQLLICAVVQGVRSRYAIPVQGFLHLFEAAGIVGCAQALAWAANRSRGRARRTAESSPAAVAQPEAGV